MITVVFPIFSRSLSQVFWWNIQQFASLDRFQVVVVDGVPSSQAVAMAAQCRGWRVSYHNLPDASRGERIAFGIAQAQQPWVLLHHPRTSLSIDALTWLKTASELPPWATFTHCFDDQHPFLRFVSWYSNWVRVDCHSVVYLDHCMLVETHLLKTVDLKPLAIFEDTVLSQRLKAKLRPQRLPFLATTSAIRFRHRGIYRQFLMNQALKLGFMLGVSDIRLNRWYERHLNLNQQN